MNREHTLEQCLHIWKEGAQAPMETGAGPEGHIPSDMLFRMAGPGGIETSSDAEVNHLSLCPDCLEKWSSWRRAMTVLEEIQEIGPDDARAFSPVVYGLRQAAASLEAKEAVSIRSSCGRFILGVLPQVDNPDKGLVTIEAAADGEMAVEGRHFTVRDRKGRVVLQGRLRHGRLARTCERLMDLDLSAWTLLVDEKEG